MVAHGAAAHPLVYVCAYVIAHPHRFRSRQQHAMMAKHVRLYFLCVAHGETVVAIHQFAFVADLTAGLCIEGCS